MSIELDIPTASNTNHNMSHSRGRHLNEDSLLIMTGDNSVVPKLNLGSVDLVKRTAGSTDRRPPALKMPQTHLKNRVRNIAY